VLADAVRKADLVIEAVPERIDIKREVYRKITAVAWPETIFATNSSTLLPSALAEATGRPDRFAALHFANEIWRHNVAEVMGHTGTSPEVIATVTQFATDIGMVPVVLHKEQRGYVLNSLLVPLLGAAATLLGKGIAARATSTGHGRSAPAHPRDRSKSSISSD
jgi:3-hydroxybutyryl-CoA dehydrogenase